MITIRISIHISISISINIAEVLETPTCFESVPTKQRL
jgi:hypothetical protein